MHKKMKFPFLFNPPETTATWRWPTCAAIPKTSSFRLTDADADADDIIDKYHDDAVISFADDTHNNHDDDIFFRGVKSERFFFEPGTTNSIMEEAKTEKSQRVTTVEIESNDPIVDFRASMEEMVTAHGLRDWENLEELLAIYLRVNSRCNHGYIVEAFVEMIVRLAAIDENCSSSSSTITANLTSPVSFSSSSSSTYSSTNFTATQCLSNSMVNEDEVVMDKNGGCSTSTSSFLSSSSGV